MAINTIATAAIFQKTLDQLAVREMLTGWMDRNAGKVKYNGGAEVKIPTITTQGLGDYDRDNGYVQGAVTHAYQTKTMTQDRGRKFQLDSQDVDETNFVVEASSVMGEFQRYHVLPEVDAYRLSNIATIAISAAKAGMVEYGYVPGAASTSALRKFKAGVKAIRESGYNGPLICHATGDFILELELELAKQITTVTFSQGGIQTQVPSVDGVVIINTPSNRLVTAITTKDGKTSGQEDGGFAKGSTAKDVNFEIMPMEVPLAITKQDKMRIFDPNTYQKADAWSMDYRRFHDIWVADHKADSLFVNIKDAKS